MKTCIINYASGAWYPRGQARLVQSLADLSFTGSVLTWNNPADLGCPPHQQVPYAFKPYALRRAKEMGFELVLWCDASVWAIRPVTPVFDYLAAHSHMFFHNTSIGMWTSDACLKGFNLDRDKAMDMSMLMGICMGFNLTAPVTQEFLNQWLAKADDGFSFPGDWNNDRKQVSPDPRCRGHRHDQSVASILACNLGMGYIIPHETFFCYWEPHMKPTIVLTAQGM